MENTNLLKYEIANFRNAQKRYSDVGACDTEPSAVFAQLMIQALLAQPGDKIEIPCTPGYPGWEIFSDMPKSEAAAWMLHDAALRVVLKIQEMTAGAQTARRVIEADIGVF